ncbi:MAG: two-component sensor histidine kinase [Rhizobacter sp.]|nr:two-component sensor histidine kinase [Rhizobacter sp.]
MDGFQRRLSESLQFRLSVMLSLAILVIAVAAGLFSFTATYADAHELQDDVLRQVAALLHRRGLSTGDAGAADLQGSDNEESRVIVQRLGPAEAGKPLDAGGKLTLPESLRDGLQNYITGGEEFRLLVTTTATGERWGVAQEAAFRDEIARDSALRAVMSLLILVPILPLIVVLLVRRMFRPVAVLSLEVDERSETALHSIQAAHVPDEVRPFIVAINRLLARAQTAMEAQRRFVADAAHELRTPLTALSLQAERLSETPLSPPAAERLQALRQGIDRGRGLLEQLLALARAQTLNEPASSVVSIQAIYRRVLEDLMPLVEAKAIDIGVEGSQDARVKANEVDLITLVKNLVDNAIRFAPVGGRVDLLVSTTPDQQVRLRVCDDGPGIPLDERSRVFDPFYRTLGSAETGSGLGLAIVEAIADRLGAQVQLGFANETKLSGLCVTVLLPSAR